MKRNSLATMCSAALMILVLSGCGTQHENSNPQKGLVNVSYEQSSLDTWVSVDKICDEANLIYITTSTGSAKKTTVITNSPQCR